MPRRKPRPLYQPAPALHMLRFDFFFKSMLPSLSELNVTPSFCFAFKIPDNVAASTEYYTRVVRVWVTFNSLQTCCHATPLLSLMMFAHVSACNLANLLLTNPWKFHRLFFILIWFPIPCIHFTDFKIKPETEMIWMNLMKIWLLATNWLEMKWTMVVLSITPQWHSSYFFNVFFLRKCNLTSVKLRYCVEAT